jgi:hypothetical protein
MGPATDAVARDRVPVQFVGRRRYTIYPVESFMSSGEFYGVVSRCHVI